MVSLRQLIGILTLAAVGLTGACYQVESNTCAVHKDCEAPYYCHPDLQVCLQATQAELDADETLRQAIGCGNGRLDEGEGCDDGNQEGGDDCSAICQPEECGNGLDDPGEECDDGENDDSNYCTSHCKRNVCGDGHQLTGCDEAECQDEGCDDGNGDVDDDCVACQPARCGDGHQRADLEPDDEGYEACDDGNVEETDACLNNCVVASCGDGVVRTGLAEDDEAFEACDDQNDVETDDCLSDCRTASCGDGHVRAGLSEGDPGYEACDDGNEDGHDGCNVRCELTFCGDGYTRTDLEPGTEGYEECDSGNDPMSLCGPDCRMAPQSFAGLSLGLSFSCAVVRVDGVGRTVRCWGKNDDGQVQDGYQPQGRGGDKPLDRIAPRLVDSDSLRDVRGIRSGKWGTCARVQGQLLCWGLNEEGMLGVAYDGGGNWHPVREPNMILTPQGRDFEDSEVHDVALGLNHACAIIGEERALYCWGHDTVPGPCCGSYNKTGTRHYEDDVLRHIPLPVLAFEPQEWGVIAIAAGGDFSAGIDSEGELVYWGRVPQIDPSPENNTLGTFPSVPQGATFQSVSAGLEHVCGLMDDGRAWCDGQRSFGRAGVNPVTRSLVGFVQVEAYAEGSCALDREGAVYCWGRNDMGQLGRRPEDLSESAQPVRIGIAGGGRVISLAKGGYAKHRCVVVQGNTGNTLRCWGDNRHGAVGHPTAGDVVVEPFDPDLSARRTGSREQPAYSCLSLRDGHDSETGGAWLQPPGVEAAAYAWCDQDTDRGGWALAMVISADHVAGSWDGALWDGTDPLLYLRNDADALEQVDPNDFELTDTTESLRSIVYAHQPILEVRMEMRTADVGSSHNGVEYIDLEDVDPDQPWRGHSFPMEPEPGSGQPTLAQVVSGDMRYMAVLAPSQGTEVLDVVLPAFPANDQGLSRWIQPLTEGADRDPDCIHSGMNLVHRAQANPAESHQRLRLGILASNKPNGGNCGVNNRVSIIGFGYGGPQIMTPVGAMSTRNSGPTVRLSATGRIWVR